MKLFLEGVYNHGEVIWLDLKWFVLSLLRVRICGQKLDDLHWVEVMPSQMLVKFCSWRSTILWKYRIENGKLLICRGWYNNLIMENGSWDDSYPFIVKVQDDLIYEAIDKFLV